MGRWISAVVWGLVAVVYGAAAPAQAPPAPDGQTLEYRYSVEPAEDTPGERGSVDVDFAMDLSDGGRLRFLCNIKTDIFMPDGWVLMRVSDQHGRTVHETPLRMPIRQGFNPCQFLWNAEEVPLGVYTARFILMRGSSFEEAARSLVVSKLAEAPLAQRIEEASRRVEDLRNHLQAVSPDPASAPYARVRLAVAGEFAERARSAFARNDWKQASYYAGYVGNTVESVRIHLTFGAAMPERTAPVVPLSMARLGMRDGGFTAQGRPVFLLGGHGGDELVRAMPHLRQHGLNWASIDLGVGPHSPVPTSPEAALAMVKGALDLAEPLNVSVSALLDPIGVVARGRDRREVDLIDPDTREAVAAYLRSAAATLRGEPMLNGVAIDQQPRFRFVGPEVREGFILRLRELYPSVTALNLVWKARLRDIGDVRIAWEPDEFGYHLRPSYQYDWQSYHQWLGAGFLAWMRGQAQAVAPDFPIFVELSDAALDPGESRTGIDQAAVALTMDLNACAVSNSPADPVYAMEYPHASLIYTLYKSFAPHKPLINTEHVLVRPDDPFGRHAFAYVHSALWEGVMSGLNGSAAVGWAPAAGSPLPGSLRDRPEAVEAYATAALDINRLAELVTAFQTMPARVAILWSMPAKIYEEGNLYLGSVRRAFEGCSFAGQKVRFITEEQIEAGGLRDVDVLVMPNLQILGDQLDLANRPAETDAFDLVKAYIDGGGVVIRTGNPISADARGRSHGEIIVPTANTILVRGTESASNYLDAMDAAYAMAALPPIPRAVNEFGYPLEGVRTLYGEIGGVPHLYLLNLRREPVACHLEGPFRGGRDLIRGDRVGFPSLLEPLRPLLVRLDDVDPSEAMPTAVVGEVPAPPERIPRPEGVPSVSPEPYPAVSAPAEAAPARTRPPRLNRPGPE